MDFSFGPLSTWGCATTVGSASCPGSTAGTAGTASSLSG
ncbi:thiocillin family RiPP [Bacillus velezensis]